MLLEVLSTAVIGWLVMILLLMVALLLGGSIQSDRVLDSNRGFSDLLPRCSQPCGGFKLLVSKFPGGLLTGDGFVLLPGLLLAFEVLQEVVQFLLRRELFLLLLLVLL